MNTPTTICLLIGSLEQGGAQRMVLRLMDGLDKLGYDVYLLTLDGNVEVTLHADPGRASQLASRVIGLGDYNVKRSVLRKVSSVPFQWLKVSRLVRRLGCTHVISFMERANIVNLALSADVKRVLCVRKHLSMAMRDKSFLKRVLIKIAYRVGLGRADIINFNARQSAADFRSLFSVEPSKISVIHNYCDPELIHRLAEEPIPEDYRGVFADEVIITCGRLLPVKGHSYLIQSFRDLMEHSDRDVHLVILGDGPLRENLRELVRQLGLGRWVHLPGYQHNPYTWLARSDIFVLPSLAEGFPNALLEAMTLGMPVIAADCPSGPRELLTELDLRADVSEMLRAEYGVLLPRLDDPMGEGENREYAEAQLTRAMEHLLASRAERDRYGRKAEERAQQYSFREFFRQWCGIIDG